MGSDDDLIQPELLVLPHANHESQNMSHNNICVSWVTHISISSLFIITL